LFRRGDVRRAERRVVFRMKPDLIFGGDRGEKYMPLRLGEVGLIHEVAIDLSTVTKERAIALAPDDIEIDLTARLWAPGAVSKSFGFSAAEKRNFERGIFDSDTGQLHLDAPQSRLEIRTPRTEAAAFADGLPINLGQLKIHSSDGPAAVAASVLSGDNLKNSERILLIFATDALNSGAEFSDPDRKVLEELGTLPVLMRSGRVELELVHDAPERLSLYALALNGERREELPLTRFDSGIRFVLDTGELSEGPTPFFEIVEEP